MWWWKESLFAQIAFPEAHGHQIMRGGEERFRLQGSRKESLRVICTWDRHAHEDKNIVVPCSQPAAWQHHSTPHHLRSPFSSGGGLKNFCRKLEALHVMSGDGRGVCSILLPADAQTWLSGSSLSLLFFPCTRSHKVTLGSKPTRSTQGERHKGPLRAEPLVLPIQNSLSN